MINPEKAIEALKEIHENLQNGDWVLYDPNDENAIDITDVWIDKVEKILKP